MRFRLPLAAAVLACVATVAGPAIVPVIVPALAQDDTSSAKRSLDKVLAVLRDHQPDAGKPCLDAMTRVHQTEDQVGTLGKQDSNSNHPDNGADVARDVLESDYETAEAACHPDAVKACTTSPAEKACVRLNAAAPG